MNIQQVIGEYLEVSAELTDLADRGDHDALAYMDLPARAAIAEADDPQPRPFAHGCVCWRCSRYLFEAHWANLTGGKT